MITLREMGNLSVTDIDTHAVAKIATITRATYKLQDDGLVNIFTSQKDGRVSIGELTEKGKLTIEKVIKNSKKLLKTLMKILPLNK
jgi:DNA-binding MarR family transcriptional regulator